MAELAEFLAEAREDFRFSISDFRFLKSAHFAIFVYLFVRRSPAAEFVSRNLIVARGWRAFGASPRAEKNDRPFRAHGPFTAADRAVGAHVPSKKRRRRDAVPAQIDGLGDGYAHHPRARTTTENTAWSALNSGGGCWFSCSARCAR